MSSVHSVVAVEYEKNPDLKPEDIQRLRDWISTQPHLPAQHITDLDLILAFHCCDFSTEVTKQLLDTHYSLRATTSVLQDLAFDQNMELSMRSAVLTILPERTKEGYRVIYSTLQKSDAKNFSFTDMVRIFIMQMDIWQRAEGTWPGLVFLIDLAGVSVAHLTKIDLGVLKAFLVYLQEAAFVKLKAVYILNTPSFIDKLMVLLKMFTSKTLLNLLHIEQGTGVDVVTSRALPKDIGGDWKDVATLIDESIQLVKESKEFLEHQSKKRASTLPGEQKAPDNYGISGSFKTLDFD